MNTIPYLIVEQGYYFGEIDLLFSEKRTHLHDVRAGEICELLTLSRENFYLLLSTYQDEGLEICGNAKERLTRIEDYLKEAEYNYKNSIPVDKHKTNPHNLKISDKIEFFDENSADSKKIDNKKPILFNKIIESKLKIKQVDGKKIKKKALDMIELVEELKQATYKLQDKVASKYPTFHAKKMRKVSDASSIESQPSVNDYESM